MYEVAICMPYYERLERLRQTLSSFEDAGYYDENIGVSIVDDGSIEEPVPKEIADHPNITVSYLPQKNGWKNPCVPLNLSVKQVESKVVLLQSPETYHPESIIPKMKMLLETPQEVVLSQVQVVGQKGMEWYAHPEHRPLKYWFCCMLYRWFYDSIGGFDEGYREGQGFDDDDFVLRLDQAGAEWVWAPTTAIHVKDRRKHRLPPIHANRSRFNDKALREKHKTS